MVRLFTQMRVTADYQNNRTIMEAITSGTFAILGVVVGALIHYLLTKKNQKEQQLVEWRNKAYIDFLEAISVVVASQRKGDKKVTIDSLSKLADAKSRICIYGEAEIIKQLAEFWREGATLETESELLAFSRFCQKIRKSIGVKSDIGALEDITQLLFSIDIKNC